MAIDFMSAGGAVLPDGGTSGQVLTKNSSTNGDASWETPGVALPAGGTAGQYLRKSANSDYSVEWANITVYPDCRSVWYNTKSDDSFKSQAIKVEAGGNSSIISNLTIAFGDSSDIKQLKYCTLTIPYGLKEISYKMVTENGYRIIGTSEYYDNELFFLDGFNTKTNTTDNSVAIPVCIYATTIRIKY